MRYIIPLLALVALSLVSIHAHTSDIDPKAHPDLLWVAQPNQLTAYSVFADEIRHQFALEEIGWLATDPATGRLWVGAGDELVLIEADGAIRQPRVPMPVEASEITAAVVDGTRRVAWLAADSNLYRYSADQYAVIDTIALPERVEALALDEAGENLFVLYGGTVTAINLTTGTQTALSVPGEIEHISIDRDARRLWLASSSEVVALDESLAPLGAAVGHGIAPLQFLAADTNGGAWISGTHELKHVSADGVLTSLGVPFDDTAGGGSGYASRLRQLMPYPQGGTVWITNNKHVRRVAEDGVRSDVFTLPGSNAAIRLAVSHHDITAPEIWITRPEPEVFTSDNRPQMDVVYTDYGSTVAPGTLVMSLDNEPIDVTCHADLQAALCIPDAEIADGYYTFSASIDDLAGNTSTPASLRFTVDTVKPGITVHSPMPEMITNQPELNIDVVLSEFAILNLNGDDKDIDENFRHESVWILAEGGNDFKFTAVDRANNTSYAVRDVLLDTIPPEISITSPSEGEITTQSEVTLKGTVSEPVVLLLDGESIELAADLSFAVQLSLQEGPNAFNLVARDVANNVTTRSHTVVKDTTPPAPIDPILVSFSYDANDNSLVFTGLPGAAEAGSSILVVPVLGATVGESLDALGEEMARRFDVNADGSFVVRVPAGVLYDIFVVDAAGQRSAGIGSAQLQEPVREGKAVGVVPGELSVDPQGNANYRIPLAIAPGAAGMQPELALLYSSAAGNGQLGVGWSLSGLSAITRCPQDVAHEGNFRNVMYDKHDRLCLDGQRLLLHEDSGNGYMSPGSRYFTELASFQRIRAYGGTKAKGVNGFKVEDKAGLVRYYGMFNDTPDGRIETDGTDTAMIWLVSRIEDRHGNHIDYEYGYQRGEYWPEKIRWYNRNGLELGRVTMFYGGRADKTLGALTDRTIRPMTKRLKRIVTYARVNGLQPVFSYLLDYEYAQASKLSRLVAVQQCAGSVADSSQAEDGACLPASGFSYSDGYVQWGARSKRDTDYGNVPDAATLRMVDLDLDGHLDMVWTRPISVTRWQLVYKLWGETEVRAISSPIVGKAQAFSFTLYDANEDGYQDIAVAHEKDRYDLHLWRNESRTFSPNVAMSFSGLTESDAGGFTPLPLDVDGDGRQELIYKRGTTHGNTHAITIRWFDGSGKVVHTDWGIRRDQHIRPIEFNGDGLPDLLIDTGDCSTNPNTIHYRDDGSIDPVSAEWSDCTKTAGVLVNRGNGIFDDNETIDCEVPRPPLPCEPLLPNCDPDTQPRVASDPYYFPGLTSRPLCTAARGTNFFNDSPIITDQNGDGLTDIITYSAASTTWKLWLNSGGMFTLADTWKDLHISADELAGSISADVNQDGIPDLLFEDERDQYLKLMTRDGFGNAPRKYLEADKDVRYADVDGDGDLDMLGYEGGWFLREHQGGRRDLLVGIITGTGERTAIAYQALAGTRLVDGRSLYQGHLSAAESEKGLQQHRNALPPLHVVTSYAVDTGTKQLISTYYTYKGFKVDATRGPLGFREVRARNSNTGIETVNIHRQSWPYTGMVEKSYQFVPERVVPELPSDDDVLDDIDWPCVATLRFCDDPSRPLPVRSGFAAATASLDAEAAGRKISETVNTFAQRSTTQGAVYPYVKQTVTTDRDYNTGAAYRKTASSFSYDAWGNAKSTDVTVSSPGGSNPLTTSTVNQYQPVTGSNESWWCLGRLSSSTVTHRWQGKTTTRKSSFGYTDSKACQLNYEKIHAMGEGEPQSLALETFYTLDDFGNTGTKRTRGWDGQGVVDRVTATTYEPTGRFPQSVTNSLGHSETRSYDKRFGALVKTVGPNGLPSETELDDFGRVIRTTGARAANTVTTVRAWCDGGSCFDTLSLYKEVKTASAGGQTITEYDRLGRVVKVAAKTFGGGWSTQEKRYDLLGREIAVSLPHAANDPVCWAFTTYDNINRPVLSAAPPDSTACSAIPRKVTQAELQAFQQNPPASYAISRTAYSGAHVAMQDAQGRNTLRAEYPNGWLSRIAELQDGDITSGQFPAVRTQDGNALETRYTYDAVGNTLKVTDPAGNRVAMSYDNRGRKLGMSDPDMGAWTYRYNAFGELIEQRDAKGQVVTMRYDRLGRMIERNEAEGATHWVYDVAPGKGIGKLAHVEQYDGFREAFSYNAYGEPENTVRVIDGQSYWQHVDYDVFGRPVDHYYPGFVAPDYATGDSIDAAAWQSAYSAFAVRTEYDAATGSPLRLRNIDISSGSSTGTVYWQRLAVDAAGRTTNWSLGNGLTEQREYNFATGLLERQRTLAHADLSANLDMSYGWDLAGNLLTRLDRIHRANGTTRAFAETFSYDALYRLDTVDRQINGVTGKVRVMNHRYDAVGNLLSQHQGIDAADIPGVRNYQYGDAANSRIRPHAVSRAKVNGKTKNYSYDPNGNLETATWSGDTRTVTWTSFNKPARIDKGQHSSTFRYGPGRQRYQQTDIAPEAQPHGAPILKTTITTTVGRYERIQKDNRLTHRFNIAAGGQVIAVRELETNIDTPETIRKQRTHYLHRDHLGSVVLITDQQGRKLERASYSAWGQRIDLNGYIGSGTFSGIDGAGSAFTNVKNFHRGYTGHDMLEGIGLINMNGRIFDPEIGRFLSADPFVQFPESTQGFNRYAYVGNNPLSFVDPSGYSFKKELGKALSTIAPVLNVIPVCYVWCAAVASAVGGYLQTGSWEVGIRAGITTAIASYVGGQIGGADSGWIQGNTTGAVLGRAVAHGILGGTLSSANGGRFGDGFLGGAAGSLAASSGIADTGNMATDIAIGAIVGGTVSEIGGGKFANGAVSGAFAAAVNNSRMRLHGGKSTTGTASKEQIEAAHERVRKLPEIAAVEEKKGRLELRVDGTKGASHYDPVSHTIVFNPGDLGLEYKTTHSPGFTESLAGLSDADYWAAIDNYPDYSPFSAERIIVHETLHSLQDSSGWRYELNPQSYETPVIQQTNEIMYRYFNEPYRVNDHGAVRPIGN